MIAYWVTPAYLHTRCTRPHTPGQRNTDFLFQIYTPVNLQALGVSVIEGIDVSDKDSGKKLVEAVRKQLHLDGSLDMVICNAG